MKRKRKINWRGWLAVWMEKRQRARRQADNPVAAVLLLEDGSNLQLEDGSDFLLE